MNNTLQIFRENYALHLQFAQHLSTLVMARFNQQGELIDCNAGFIHLIGQEFSNQEGLNIRDKFISPCFADFISIDSQPHATIYEGILTIGDYEQNNRSVLGSIVLQEDDFILFAEHDLKSLEQLNSSVITLNEELTQLQRDVLKANRMLQQKEVETREGLEQLSEMNIRLQSEIAQRRQAEKRLKYFSMHDELTRLPNHAFLNEQINKILSLAERNQQPVGMMFIDIDHFKQINDNQGHAQGDVALVEISLVLKDAVRKSDVAGRWGGDEFLVLLPNFGSLQDLENTANRILKAANQPFESLNSQPLSLSIGISIYPDQARQADKLIMKADESMYKAKKAGGNQYFITQ